jgi:hypothetical protein
MWGCLGLAVFGGIPCWLDRPQIILVALLWILSRASESSLVIRHQLTFPYSIFMHHNDFSLRRNPWPYQFAWFVYNTVHKIRGRNDNSWHSVHGIRERNDTSGIRSTESVNAMRVLAFGQRNPWTQREFWRSVNGIRGRSESSGGRSTESVDATRVLSFGPRNPWTQREFWRSVHGSVDAMRVLAFGQRNPCI